VHGRQAWKSSALRAAAIVRLVWQTP